MRVSPDLAGDAKGPPPPRALPQAASVLLTFFSKAFSGFLRAFAIEMRMIRPSLAQPRRIKASAYADAQANCGREATRGAHSKFVWRARIVSALSPSRSRNASP